MISHIDAVGDEQCLGRGWMWMHALNSILYIEQAVYFANWT
jgi:hypothetical protein